MMTAVSMPICAACKREIIGRATVTATNKLYHPLCWQKECNDYYYEQTADAADDNADQ